MPRSTLHTQAPLVKVVSPLDALDPPNSRQFPPSQTDLPEALFCSRTRVRRWPLLEPLTARIKAGATIRLRTVVFFLFDEW